MRTQHIPDTLHGELKTSYVGACHPKRILDFVSRCKPLRNLVRKPLREFGDTRKCPHRKRGQGNKGSLPSVPSFLRYAVYNYSARSVTMPKPTTGLVKPFPGMAA
jgi:hypothetical protein